MYTKKFLFSVILILIYGASYAQVNPNIVTFEPGTLNGGFVPAGENSIIDNNYFHSTYGINFYNTYSWAYYSPKYAKAGHTAGSNPAAFVNSNKMDAACTQVNSTDDNAWDASVGTECWMLTDDDGAIKKNPKQLLIEYDQAVLQCTFASGYLYDLDGITEAEGWRLDIYAVGGGGTPDQTIYLLAPSWNQCLNCPTVPAGATIFNSDQWGNYSGGDGTSVYWEMNTTTNVIDYLTLTYVGSPDRGVGVAFDNFYYCSKAEEDPCLTEPDFNYSVNGCLVDFTDITPFIPAGEIINYHWDFGDGTHSTEVNPQHQFLPNSTHTVTLTVTIFDGNQCCTRTVSKEVATVECLPCDAEIGFTWEPDCYDLCKLKLKAIVNNNTTAILGYYWDFGNGNRAWGPEVEYNVTNLGQVCLTVVFVGNSGQPNDCCSRTICGTVDCGTMGQHYDSDPEGSGLMPDPLEDTETHGSEDDPDSEDLSDKSTEGALYPNPSDQVINLRLYREKPSFVTIELISINGDQYVLEDKYQLQAGPQEVSLDVSRYPNGLYTLKLSGDGSVYTERLEIRHNMD